MTKTPEQIRHDQIGHEHPDPAQEKLGRKLGENVDHPLGDDAGHRWGDGVRLGGAATAVHPHQERPDHGEPDHGEGGLAHSIEAQTARLPSDVWLWAAGGSIALSLALQASDEKQKALFVGNWAPTFLLLGIYSKLVKVLGSD